MMKRNWIWMAVAALAITTLGVACSQEASNDTDSPATSTPAPTAAVALDGYCPVAYHKMNKAVKGKKEFSATHNGKTYYFVKAMARDLFVKNPDRFLPAIDGQCAVCKASGGKNVPGNPAIFSVYKKKLYLFPSTENKAKFDAAPEKYLAKLK